MAKDVNFFRLYILLPPHVENTGFLDWVFLAREENEGGRLYYKTFRRDETKTKSIGRSKPRPRAAYLFLLRTKNKNRGVGWNLLGCMQASIR